MGDTNYFSGIVKILENPIETSIQNDKTWITKLRAEMPQFQKTKIISLIFFGNLAKEIKDCYHINDYILIEGYISTQNKKQIFITVLKVHPFFFN